MKIEFLLSPFFFFTLLGMFSFAVLPSSAEEENLPASSDAIADALQPFVDSHFLAGAVTLVANKAKTLDLQSVGYEDVAAHKPMATGALFWVASETKPITATCLMMLVDEGKAHLDDPVEKYLPEFHGQWLAAEHDDTHLLLKKPAHPITLREILSHTSGLPFASPMEQPTLDTLPLMLGARSYAMTPLQFEPGGKYQYSNAGINTAGRIIEVLTGMSYADFLKRRLLTPLGMKDTTFWPSKAQVARMAKSYKPNADKTNLEETTITQLRYPLDDRSREPMPAGGLFSTAADMARFCQMILNGGVWAGKRIVSEAAIREMTRKQTGENIKEGYGLGWLTGGGVFGHGGAYATNMMVDSNHGLILIYMVQHAGFPGNGDQSFEAFKKAAMAQFGSHS